MLMAIQLMEGEVKDNLFVSEIIKFGNKINLIKVKKLETKRTKINGILISKQLLLATTTIKLLLLTKPQLTIIKNKHMFNQPKFQHG